eukprot:2496286-Alexandrium_andersonii.AAC.1
MSASLVGSEMCIRDRTALPKRRGAATRQPNGAPARGCAEQLRTRCHISVSYTHLTLPTICSV